MNPLIKAIEKGIEKSGFAPCNVCIASDIPFKPETVKNLGVDFFHVIRGRTVAFGTGIKLANPMLKVVPVVGDLMTLGGNHVVHAGRRNMELHVICVNTFIYDRIAGKKAPSADTRFANYSTFESPFNVPHVANSCGAVFTARWTALHTNEIADSIAASFEKSGFTVVEVLCPGPNFYSDIDHINEELLSFYHENSDVRNGEEPRSAEIDPEEKIAVGNFTDIERPTFLDVYNIQLPKRLGDKFTPYCGCGEQNG